MPQTAMPEIWHEEGNTDASDAVAQLKLLYDKQANPGWYRQLPSSGQFFLVMILGIVGFSLTFGLELHWLIVIATALGLPLMLHVPSWWTQRKIASLTTRLRLGNFGSVMQSTDREYEEFLIELEFNNLNFDNLLANHRAIVDRHLGPYIFSTQQARSVLYKEKKFLDDDDPALADLDQLRNRARIAAEGIANDLPVS